MMSHPALLIAQTLQQTGDYNGALDVLTNALKKEPYHADILRARAHLFISNGNIFEAEKDLDLLLQHHSQDALALDDRGVLYQQQGDYYNALQKHLAAADLEPAHDGILHNLAIALNYLGEKNVAKKLYQDILSLNPQQTKSMINLSVIYDEEGNPDEAQKLLAAAKALGDTSFELCSSYGNVLRHKEKFAEAAEWYKKALSLRPDNQSILFMLETVSGQNPSAPPAGYVAELFDSYADNFDHSLVSKLKYRTPELIMAAMKPFIAEFDSRSSKAIDLGAGTGLFGALVRPFVGHSIGLDLSKKMLNKAQEKNIYDAIMCLDIVTGLEKFSDAEFDLISATDVFVYLGGLDKSFAEIARTLKSGGLFAFSTEAITDHADENDFILRDTGRYAHSEAYLKTLAGKCGFDELHFQRDWIRYNKDSPLDGFIVILKKGAVPDK